MFSTDLFFYFSFFSAFILLTNDQLVRDLMFIDKLVLRCKREPLVPLGCLLTCGALILSAKSIQLGNQKTANKYFLLRVAFQGLTVAALVAGGYYYKGQKLTPEGRKIDREAELKAKAKMRERLWIEDLERRDAEAKERRARAEAARKRIQEEAVNIKDASAKEEKD